MTDEDQAQPTNPPLAPQVPPPPPPPAQPVPPWGVRPGSSAASPVPPWGQRPGAAPLTPPPPWAPPPGSAGPAASPPWTPPGAPGPGAPAGFASPQADRSSGAGAWIAAVVVVVVIVGGLGAVLIVNSRHSTPDPNKVINLALEPDQPMPADFKTLGSSYDYQIGVPVGWTIVPVSDAAIQRMIAQRPGDEGYRRTVEQFAASMRNSGSLLALAPRRGAFVDNVIIDERSTAATGISNLSEQRVRSELEASPTNVSNIAIERLVINRRPVLHVSYSLGSTGTVGNQYLVVAHGKAFDVTVTAAAADAPVARQIAQTFVVR